MSTKEFIVMVMDTSPSPGEQLAVAKKAATDGGGTIVKELPHINGFTVSYPEGSLRKDTVDLLLSNEHIHVEEDGEVRTQ